jgi:hypothetical protein
MPEHAATPAETNPYAWVRKALPRVVVGALVAAALVGVYAVVLGQFNETCWRLIGTITLFVFFALVSWYDADVSARRAPWFGAVSVITSVYLLFAGLAKLWFPPAYDLHTPFWEPLSWFLLVAVTRIGLLHIHLVLNTQRRFTGPVMSKVTICTLILVGLLTFGLSLPLLLTRAEFGEGYWRSLAVVAILDALGTILIPLSYSLFHREAEEAYVPAAPVHIPPMPSTERDLRPGQTPPATPFTLTPTAAAPAAAAPQTAPPSAYPTLVTAGGLRLEWPRYLNGQPLPAKADGTPDFTGVVGY